MKLLPVLVIFLNGISTSRINGFDGLNDNAEVSSSVRLDSWDVLPSFATPEMDDPNTKSLAWKRR